MPTLVLNARNDPFLPEQALLAAARKAAPCVVLEFPRTRRPCRILPGRSPAAAGSRTSSSSSNRDQLPAEIFRTYDIRGVVGR